jgi:flagellar protein FlaG
MPDPISMPGGMAPIVPASFVNPQAQAQAARPQTAGTTGTRHAQEGAASQPQIATPTSVQNGSETQKAQGAEQAKEQPPSKITIEEAVTSFKEYLEALPSDLQFKVDKETDRHVFKLVNPITREVVRQFPPDEFLTMVKRLRDVSDKMMSNNGVILDDRF